MLRVPKTTSELVESPVRHVVDLTEEGVPEIPRLGVNRSPATTEGSILHCHEGCLEITYCARGSVRFDCEGREYAIIPGGVFVSQPNDRHRLTANPKGAKVYWLFFRLPKRDESVFGLNVEETRWIVRTLRTLPSKTFSAPAAIGLGFERLFALLASEKKGSVARRLKIRVAAQHLLVALIEAGLSASNSADDVQLQAVIDRMRREPKSVFSLEELAQELKCSPNTVRARFKRLTGLPPQSFALKCRIDKAVELLRTTDRTVTDIALELGFSSSQNFAIRCRQETGKSPTECRKASD